MMPPRFALFVGLLVATWLPCNAEPLLRYDVGKSIETAFLLDWTMPFPPEYRIGIVNTELGIAMRVSRRTSGASVDYARGDTWLWQQAAEQVPQLRDQDTPIRFKVRRWQLDAKSCPPLQSVVETFWAELDAVGAEPVGSGRVTSKYQRDEIILDGTQFHIQVESTTALLTITPDAGTDTPLHRATQELNVVAARCANSMPPSIDEHRFR